MCEATPPAASAPPSSPPSQRDHDRQLWTGAAIAGGGAVALVAGLYLGHRASELGSDVSSACAVSCDWGAEKSADSDGHRDATLGRVLDVVGILAIAGGGALSYLAHRDDELSLTSLSSLGRTTGVAVSWSARW